MKLALDSSYKVGLAYEKLSLEVLRRYVFHLKHTGRSGDEGQDFSGYWIISRKAVAIVGEAARSTMCLPTRHRKGQGSGSRARDYPHVNMYALQVFPTMVKIVMSGWPHPCFGTSLWFGPGRCRSEGLKRSAIYRLS